MEEIKKYATESNQEVKDLIQFIETGEKKKLNEFNEELLNKYLQQFRNRS